MANNSFTAVPQNLKDSVAMRRFLESLVVEIDKLRESEETLKEEVKLLKLQS